MSGHFNPSRRSGLVKLGALAGSVALPHAWGQGARQASIIVPVPPGGTMDGIARLLAENLKNEYGGSVIVENKPGAATRLGIQAVRAAPSDGRTLLFISVSPFTIYPYVYKNLGYDPDKDVVPVAPVVNYDFGLAVPGSSPIMSVKDFVEGVKTDSKLGIYGVPGAGTATHFSAAALATAAQIELKHVAYKGSAPLMQDLLGGHVLSCVNILPEFLPYVKAGKVRVLATTGARRSPLTPDIPTFAELGYKGMVLDQQFALFAPKGTPAATVSKLNMAVQAIVQKPDIKRRLADMGFTTLSLTADQFASKILADRETWAPIVKRTGFTADE